MGEQSPDYSLFREQVNDALASLRVRLAKRIRKKIELEHGLQEIARDVETWIIEDRE